VYSLSLSLIQSSSLRCLLSRGVVSHDCTRPSSQDDALNDAGPARLRIGDFDTAVRFTTQCVLCCDQRILTCLSFVCVLRCQVRASEPVVEFTGTPAIQPPEMFAFEPHHTPTDIWSLGILIGWMLTLSDPMGPDATMTEWEARVSADPPKLPVFEEQASFDGTPLEALAGTRNTREAVQSIARAPHTPRDRV
jgi:serine/threonine protein kinase